MKAMDDNEFENQLKRTVRELGLESPSIGFTNSVMAEVQKASLLHITKKYQPLIPRSVWYLLAVLVLGVFGFLVYGNQFFGIAMISSTDLSWPDLERILEKAPTITVSRTVVYSFVILAIFMSVQVVLLKHHFDKRMT